MNSYRDNIILADANNIERLRLIYPDQADRIRIGWALPVRDWDELNAQLAALEGVAHD